MYTIKGFAEIAALVDNTTSVIAPLGELAPIGMTYSREKTYFSNETKPGVSLTVFSAKLDGTYQAPDATVANPIIDVIHWIYNTSLTGAFSYDITTFEAAFLNYFAGIYAIKHTGKIVRYGSAYCPEVFEFELLKAASPTTVTIWFSSDAFLSQYDEFETRVIPPLENLDAFFDTYVNVQNKLSQITMPGMMDRVEIAADRYPYTRVRFDTFDWVNPANNAVRLPTDWAVVEYGTAGDNLDTAREIIVEYVLANSTHTRDEWAALFPDLFTSTEFIITPFWNNYAIPNRVLETGMYSPSVTIDEVLSTVKKTTFGTRYDDQWITGHLSVSGTTYKSVVIAAVGGPDNRDKLYTLHDKFEDYVLIPSIHPDFQRMSLRTREFCLMLTEMLIAAESMTPYSQLPIGYNRVKRNGVIYITKTYERVQYLVVSKYSMNDPLVGF